MDELCKIALELCSIKDPIHYILSDVIWEHVTMLIENVWYSYNVNLNSDLLLLCSRMSLKKLNS